MEFLRIFTYIVVVSVIICLVLNNMDMGLSELVPVTSKIHNYLGSDKTQEPGNTDPSNKTLERDIESSLSYMTLKNMGSDLDSLKRDIGFLKESFQGGPTLDVVTSKTFDLSKSQSLPTDEAESLPQISNGDLKEVLRKDNPYLPPNDRPSPEYQNFSNNAQVNNIDNMPDYLIPQVEHTPIYNDPVPCNSEVNEKTAEFGSEQTNLATFFKSNQDLFLDANRHSSYVPNVTDWNEESKYSNILIDRSVNRLDAVNYDQQQTPYDLGDTLLAKETYTHL